MQAPSSQDGLSSYCGRRGCGGRGQAPGRAETWYYSCGNVNWWPIILRHYQGSKKDIILYYGTIEHVAPRVEMSKVSGMGVKT